MADNDRTKAEIPNQSLTVSDAKQAGTRKSAYRTMTNDLPLVADDGWDMSPRREADIMLDMPTTFEPITPDRPIPTSRGVLSAAEIEALLRPNLDDMPEPEPEPVKVTDVDVPSLRKLAPTEPTEITEDARRIASRLTLALRDGCGLKAAALARASARGSFDQGLETECAGRGSAIACYSAPGGEIAAMLVISASLANALIETACGGKPTQGHHHRALTPMDAALLEGLVRPLGAALASSLKFSRIETDAEFACALAGPGMTSILDLDVRVDDIKMSARLILAEDDLFDLSSDVPTTRSQQRISREVAPVVGAGAMTAVLTARVATLSVPMSRLANLKPGSTLLLGVPADQPVELLTGGRDGAVVAEGEIGRKGNRMAVRINRRTALLR
ncbi:FliM/FliN family flagellar motor switch protein [Hyphomonas sp. L-53-1-40]|uniref:FliM/FliN family flagellar motor switch protein n=1 Tax=Hyphomonas sp. L-53-1-40 TaxID=1207058 RepID=UPI000A07BDDD|nr:flagellar motor switch protein FliM [Hyphomonas sp. L-53-1-40]